MGHVGENDASRSKPHAIRRLRAGGVCRSPGNSGPGLAVDSQRNVPPLPASCSHRTAEAAPAKFVLSIPRFSTGSAFSLAGGRHPAVLHVLRPTSSTETGHAQLEPLLLRQPRASRRRHRARPGVVRAPLRLLAPLAGIRSRAAGGCVCQRQLRDRSDAPLHRVTPSWAAAGQDSSGWPR
jgi:hypothetical protein